MKNNRFFLVSIIYPIVCILILHLFDYVAFAQFPGRDSLYRFLGWYFLPLYAIIGAFVCITLIAISIMKARTRKLSLLQLIVISLFNIVSWGHIAISYIKMV